MSKNGLAPGERGTSQDAARITGVRVGFTAAVRTPTGEAAVARAFDPTAEETLFFPRLVGG
jgi:hypothetical protein